MKSSRAEKASYRLALFSSFVLSMTIAVQPTIAPAADGDTTTITTVAMPRADTGSRQEPSSNAAVVLHGTRPFTSAATEVPNVRNEAPPPPYMGFVPRPLTGSEWNTEYNYNGLNYTLPGGAAE